MVRRLIQRFLHWLRNVLAQVRGKKSHRQTSMPQLPPSFQQQIFDERILSQQLLSPSRHQTRPSTERISPQPYAQERPIPPPNPAANRAANPSSFKVLLSDHEYSPSSDIQNLSRQLSHPVLKTAPAQKQSKPSLGLEKTTARQDRINLTETNTTERKTKQVLFREGTGSISLSSIESQVQSRREPVSVDIKTHPSSVVANSSPQLSTEQVPKPEQHQPLPIPTTPDTDPSVIIKQGTVKLLFKLKKNNHHGYVAPYDGSKDIIFHKKYVGEDVFCQLERGMAVEVTAHVTEGKAYADHIRIL